MSSATVRVPATMEDLGIRRSMLEDLALKIVYLTGEMSLQELGNSIRLTHSITSELFQRLRKEQLCEVTGMVGNVYRIQTTSRGKTRALELLQLSQYAGPAPVTLDEYVKQVRAQSVRQVSVHQGDMESTFRHLVLDKEVLKQLGTAITSGRAIFLYGTTGSGKTTVVETITSLFGRNFIWLPYAVEVDGQIITVFDPHLHECAAQENVPDETDPRWVLCHRPKVKVGGELTIEMLDLQYNPLTRFYDGPVQMKANNGVLFVDDFGRQRVRPEELLNRWVVPLDRQVDYLSLAGGKKIEIPFDMFVVFATNLEIGKLVDEAFLRRIQTKVRLDYVTPEQFRQIFANVCREWKLQYREEIVARALSLITRKYHQPLRACYPSDLINQVIWAAKYEGSKPELTSEAIDQACRNYFIIPETESQGAA